MFNSIFQRSAPTQTGINNINSVELKNQIDTLEPVFILDVRSPQEYANDGHISGAYLMPLQTLAARLQELPKDTPIVCVCRSGARSMVACENLAKNGFGDVSNLSGGMISWKSANYPTSYQ